MSHTTTNLIPRPIRVSFEDGIDYLFRLKSFKSFMRFSCMYIACCDDTMIIKSSEHPEGYLKAPPIYDDMSEPKNAKRIVECLYKFYGLPDERIQLFYEDFDLYYPYDIYKFNKIEYVLFC